MTQWEAAWHFTKMYRRQGRHFTLERILPSDVDRIFDGCMEILSSHPGHIMSGWMRKLVEDIVKYYFEDDLPFSAPVHDDAWDDDLEALT